MKKDQSGHVWETTTLLTSSETNCKVCGCDKKRFLQGEKTLAFCLKIEEGAPYTGFLKAQRKYGFTDIHQTSYPTSVISWGDDLDGD